MNLLATLLLAFGALIAFVAVQRFSPASTDPSVWEFLRIWRTRAKTVEGHRVLGWLNLALSLQLLGTTALVLRLLLRS